MPWPNSLGYIYASGVGVPKDDVEAAKWYGLAAGWGDAAAQYNLAIMYENGGGMPKDDAEAIKWF